MSIITRNQITIVTIDDGTPGPSGPRGASSVGLGLKMNYSTFTAVNPGEVYLHGYDEAGDPSDVDGFIYYQDTKITVKKRMINPNAVIDGFLVVELSTGEAYVASYDYLQNQFKIADASYGKDGYVVDAVGWLFIGRMKNDASENTTSAILYERAVDMATALQTVFSEVIFQKTDVTQAEFDALLQYTQTQFFSRLAVNNLFVNDLTGNTAFIDSLISEEAFINDATVRKLVIEETVNGVVYTIHIDKDHGIELTVDGVTKFHASPNGSLIARDASLINSSVSGIFTSPEFSTQKAGAAGTTSYSKTTGDIYKTCDFFNFIQNYMRDNPDVTGVSGQFGTYSFSEVVYFYGGSRSMDALQGDYISNGVLYVIRTAESDPFPPLMSTEVNLSEVYDTVASTFVATVVDDGIPLWDNPTDAFLHFLCDDLIAEFSALPTGTSMPFTGNFSITYDANSFYSLNGPDLQMVSITSTLASKYSLLLSGTSLEIYDPDGVFIVSINTATRATSCVVDIAVESVKEGIKVKNIMPSADNVYKVGETNLRFQEIHGVSIYGGAVYGAVGNDVADFIQAPEGWRYGYAHIVNGEYFGIPSDTYSIAAGKKAERTMPRAIAGFVLCFVDKPYPRNTPLTYRLDGVLTKKQWWMIRPVIARYMEQPEAETWGSANVNGRHMVQVVF